MTADVTEQQSPSELLNGFKTRYQDLLNQNKELANKIKENETTALKLLEQSKLFDISIPTQPEGAAETEEETTEE